MKEERIGPHRLILGDCLEVMPTLGKVDAVVTDPPYGIGENDKKIASRTNLATAKDYGVVGWDNEPASAAHIAMMRDVSDHQIIFGGNYFDGLAPTSCWLVWDKQNTGDFADCELAWTNLPKAVRRIYWRWNGMIRKGDDVREHPTQKPVALMEWIIKRFNLSAKTIADFFGGSGSTLIAAEKNGIEAFIMEFDPKYCDVIITRWQDFTGQTATLESTGQTFGELKAERVAA